jgi:hypothetical protein
MRTRFLLFALAFTSAPLIGGTVNVIGGTVTFTLFPDSSAAAGSDFHWQFTLANNTSNYLSLTFVDSTFPAGDGFAADNPPVTPDLTLFNAAYSADGLPPGTTSSQLPLAFYNIAPGATPGSQVGSNGGPCCTLTIEFDAFASPGYADYAGSDVAPSDMTAVAISGDAFVGAPEPEGGFLALGGLLILGARRWLWRLPARRE